MKKNILPAVLLAILCCFNFASAQTVEKHWTCNPYLYQFNMTIVGAISVDDVELTSDSYEVGAFCGSECRGSEMLRYYPQVNRYLVFMTLYGEDGDELDFRLYDHAIGEEMNVRIDPLTFEGNAMHGLPSNPYIFDFSSTRNIAVTIDPAEGGTVTGAGVYPIGSTCTLTATPNDKFVFLCWKENDEPISTETEITFAIDVDRDLVACFLPVYTITASANPVEGGNVDGAGDYVSGTTCTLTATASENYAFIGWLENNVQVSDAEDYTFTVTSNRDLVAKFLPVYTIAATADPEEGGAVAGTGDFISGNACTLTATANERYAFAYWSENDVQVSTASTYMFTVDCNRDLVAHFLPIYTVVAAANPAEGGSVEGSGDYVSGNNCTLTATANTGYSFVLWSDNGVVVSTEATYTFAVTSNCTLEAQFVAAAQTMQFEEGWTWLSTYIEQENFSGLSQLEESLIPNGVMIKSQKDGFMVYDANVWMGFLPELSNEDMYLVNVSAESEVTFNGAVAVLDNHPITLNPNWTWIGYPSPYAVDIDEALSNLDAMDGDVLKTQNIFSTYIDGEGWFGSLNTLLPGMGYKYQSHRSGTVTLTYSYGTMTAMRTNVTDRNNHWTSDEHAYPNTMNMVVTVELNGNELRTDRFELAAFSEGECRGSARLTYVEPLDRFFAFLSVAGDETANLRFALYDTESEKNYRNDASMDFVADEVVGSVKEPCVLQFADSYGMDEFDALDVALYPNPVAAGGCLNLAAPLDNVDSEVIIFNSLGVIVAVEQLNAGNTTIKVPENSGVYVLKFTNKNGSGWYKKLIVK